MMKVSIVYKTDVFYLSILITYYPDALDNDIRPSQDIEAFLNYFDKNKKDQAQTDEGGVSF